jgi:hypothetical protein
MGLASFLKWSTGSMVAVWVSIGRANAGDEGRIIELSDPAEISQAAAVKTAIDALVDAAALCRKTMSKTTLECGCSSRSGMARLQSTYDLAVATHPEWPRPNTTVWWSGTALNVSAIKRALDTCQ